MSDINVTSTSTDKNYISNIKTGKHEFNVDEPLDKGGLDTAAKPSELLGAALASCTSITLQMYMNHKEFEEYLNQHGLESVMGVVVKKGTVK